MLQHAERMMSAVEPRTHSDQHPVDSLAVDEDLRVAPCASRDERKRLRAIVEYLKPAHTHFVDLVEPLPPVVPDHWEIGVSEVGVATVTH